MNATKRKFNALLQGIGARPTSPAASPSSDANATPASLAAPADSPYPAGSPLASRSSPLLSRTPTAAPAAVPTANNDNDTHDPSTMPYIPNTPSSASADFLKRRRVGTPSSTPAADARGASPSISVVGAAPGVTLRRATGSISSSVSLAAAARDKAGLAAPRYCPGDRDQLIRRLATFQEITDWTPKPDRVNEIEWAKRGWVCQGKERLSCTLCSKELVVKLNRKVVDGKEVPVLIASEIEDALVEKYVELMVEAHQDDCLWRKRGSDDHLLRLPLGSSYSALEGLRKRYDELCFRKDFLPYEFNLRLPESLDLDAVIRDLPPNFFTEPPPPAPPRGLPVVSAPVGGAPNRTALALALMGWQGLENPKIGAVPNSASCHTCLRRLGLWMFKSKEVDPDTNTVLVPAAMDHLDPLREHRFFCPWNNADVQRNPGNGGSGSSNKNLAGWQILAQVVKNESYLRNRGSKNSSSSSGGGGVGSRLFGHRSSKSVGGQPVTPGAGSKTAPTTPVRPSSSAKPPAAAAATPQQLIGDGDEDEEDEATRDAKDKERWARLRRVKSLFDPKGAKKARRMTTTSRPDTRGSGTGSVQAG